MKKIFMIVIVMFIFTAGAATGVTASSTLKEITAYLDSGLKIKLFGKDFTPLSSEGEPQTPINYNGSVYLPLRSVAEATHLSVNWDNETRTVELDAQSDESSENNTDTQTDIPVAESPQVSVEQSGRGLQNDHGEPIQLLTNQDYKVKWSFHDENEYAWLSAVKDSQDNYYMTTGKGIMALNKQGEHKWSYDAPLAQNIILGSDQKLYVLAEDILEKKYSVMVFDLDGKLIWEKTLEGYDLVYSFYQNRFISDESGNFIAFTDHGVVSFSPDGDVNWTRSDLSNDGYNRIYTDGKVILVLSADKLFALDKLGKTKWILDGDSEHHPVIFHNGQFYYNHAFYDIESKSLIKSQIEDPLLASEARDYYDLPFNLKSNSLSNISNDPKAQWTYSLLQSEQDAGYYFASLSIDKSGIVLASTNGNTVHAIGTDGKEQFQLQVNNSTISLGVHYFFNQDGSITIIENNNLVTVGR